MRSLAQIFPQAIAHVRLDVRALGYIPIDIERAVWARDGYVCRYCGQDQRLVYRSTPPLELDHVLPLAQGGTSSIENLVVACHGCNRRKGNRTPEEAGMRLMSIPEVVDG